MEPIPDKVEGGVIVKDSQGKPIGRVASGPRKDEPSDRILGVFLDNARDLIPIPPPTEEVLLKRWEPVVKDAHAVGLTAVHDALLQPNTIDFFHKLVGSDPPALRALTVRLQGKRRRVISPWVLRITF